MKWLIIFVFFFCTKCTSKAQDKPKLVILDTDIAGDYDDVGAIALLHAFADKNEIEILATISCNAFHTTAPTLSVLNTYFNRADIPIGVTKRTAPNKNCPQGWAEALLEKYSHDITSNDQAMEAVSLYRKTLASQADQSVTIITIGFFTNLADLLASKGDQHSPLTGQELLVQKVKLLTSMAGALGSGKKRGREYNVRVDVAAAQQVLADWPTPIILSPLEVGHRIRTGIKLSNNESIQNSPVKDAYKIGLTEDNNIRGRMSWDQTAVWVAVRGVSPYFDSRMINFKILDDGTNMLIPGERFEYLENNRSTRKIAEELELLMMHQPALRDGRD